jgi:hypothetical protein
MTNKMKQTAVDWLIDMLVTENEITLKGENYKLFEQAKQMEKEIIRTAYLDGMDGEYNTSEQYYNETFKSE